ncbi:hypothetical protein ACLOJK_004026 [Asimina triloba]
MDSEIKKDKKLTEKEEIQASEAAIEQVKEQFEELLRNGSWELVLALQGSRGLTSDWKKEMPYSGVEISDTESVPRTKESITCDPTTTPEAQPPTSSLPPSKTEVAEESRSTSQAKQAAEQWHP